VRSPSSTRGSELFASRWLAPACFSLSVLLFLWGLDSLLWRQLGPWNSLQWREKQAALQVHRRRCGEPRILVLGDSTVDTGILPSLLPDPGSFNLGRVALNPSELPYLAGELERMDLHPRTLLLSMTPYDLANGLWENRYAAPFRDKAGAVLGSFYRDPNLADQVLAPGKALVRGIVSSELRAGLPALRSWLGGARPRSFRIDPDGSSHPLNPAPAAGPVERSRIDFPYASGPRLVPGFETALRIFRRDCGRKGMRVIWVRLPLNPLYARDVDQHHPGFLASCDQAVRRVFGPDILDVPQPMPPQWFRDGVHFNEDGARSFSLALGSVLAGLGHGPGRDPRP